MNNCGIPVDSIPDASQTVEIQQIILFLFVIVCDPL
jgi:hypothetical protein